MGISIRVGIKKAKSKRMLALARVRFHFEGESRTGPVMTVKGVRLSLKDPLLKKKKRGYEIHFPTTRFHDAFVEFVEVNNVLRQKIRVAVIDSYFFMIEKKLTELPLPGESLADDKIN
jgi:hypothetical protein